MLFGSFLLRRQGEVLIQVVKMRGVFIKVCYTILV
ncbi:hypothetical protein DAD63_10350 [Streptococcus agalactiae]|uniref:Uncharacterized protein n=1 Tax=Streptococcus agalactiae serotype V (strain ATCC BAA-611 / 2603 V/R) TaxID=208435 RepID=Q8DZH8_STRA5|nr:hypothetical protein SAG1123 [Streptococcus agalactiae 2603V/R]AWQ29416.1 hypothetical protein CUZ18_04875 [Streptococcus agalactiae]AYY63698.1 hypothetical protein EGX70_01915 [Streptococcus sp. FDAARGOS_522]AYY68594.1 hypothetical protein EGX72_06240 [Streptococcus sp. FDAARGOS_521]AXO12569.1 hypothetical protein DY328_10580 [Streptococcus agalactiae]